MAPGDGPGRFPDPDMLQIGSIGIPNSPNPSYTPSRLTREEQSTQFALWCLLSAPLLLSCDIAGMDEATFRLLTNDGLIAINQDPLAAPPSVENRDSGILVYRKPLADGSEAVGIFNRSGEHRTCRLDDCRYGRDLRDGETRELCGEVHLVPHSSRIFRTVPARSGAETADSFRSVTA